MTRIATDFDKPLVLVESLTDGTAPNQHMFPLTPDGEATRSTGNPMASEASFAVSRSQAALVGVAVEEAEAWAATPAQAGISIARLSANSSRPFTPTGFALGLQTMLCPQFNVDLRRNTAGELVK
jgi:hypothetical protein